MLSPDGEWIWWFDDTDGDERGRWMRQAFPDGAGWDIAGGAAAPEPAVPDLPPGYPVGLALGRTVAAVGMSDRDGVRIDVHRFDTAVTTSVYTSRRHASVRALSYDETVLAIEHAEHGDAFHPAVRVFRLTPEADRPATVVGDLWDGPDRGLRVAGFAPCDGDARLLLHHERSGRAEALVWDLDDGSFLEPRFELAGEVSASWYPDGSALLVRHHWQARDELYRYDLADQRLSRLETPPGVVQGSGVRPDGTVEYGWSAGDRQSVVLSSPSSPAAP